MKIEKKKGVSDVIATVLILLLTIMGASTIGVVVINFVKPALENSKVTCLEIQDEIKIIPSGSCYYENDTDNIKNTIVKVKLTANITEFNIYLDTASKSDVYRIKSGEKIPNVRNNATEYGDELLMPSINGGEKSYYINNTIAKKIRIAAVANGKVCPTSDIITLEKC